MADSSDDCFTDLHEEERVLPTKQITSRINGSYTQVAQNLTNNSQQASHKELYFKCNLCLGWCLKDQKIIMQSIHTLN